jgi:hypothetical protein
VPAPVKLAAWTGRKPKECSRARANCNGRSRPPRASRSVSLASREVNAATVAFVRGDRDRAADLLARGESVLRKAGFDPADEDEICWLREQLSL